jgi:hypothetical protein
MPEKLRGHQRRPQRTDLPAKKKSRPQTTHQKDFRGQEGGTHTTRPFSPRVVAARRGQVEATPGPSFMCWIAPSLA